MNYKGLRTVCSKSKELKNGYLQLELDLATNTIYSSFCEKKDVLPCRYLLIGYLSKEASMVEIESLADKAVSQYSHKNFKANIHFTVTPVDSKDNHLADVTIDYNSLVKIKGIKLLSKDGKLILSMPGDTRNCFITFLDHNFEETLKDHIYQFYHSILNNQGSVSNSFTYERHQNDSGVNVYVAKCDNRTVKATVGVYLNNLLKVNYIKILSGKNGSFVVWPSISNLNRQNDKEPKYIELVYPINSTADSFFKEKILKKYKEINS